MRASMRPLAVVALAVPLAACPPGAEDVQSRAADPIQTPVASAPAPAPTSAGPRPGRWAGAASDGFRGDSVLFTVSPDGRVQDVEFRGHWRCASATSSFKETKRMDVGHVPGTFEVGPDGTFSGEKKEPYLLWTLAGRFAGPSQASGTIRIEYATDCDTHRLSWTAAPVP